MPTLRIADVHAAELGAAQRGIPLQDALAYIKRRSGRWSDEQETGIDGRSSPGA